MNNQTTQQGMNTDNTGSDPISIKADVDKIQIDSQGFLSLVRKGRSVAAFCPYASHNMTIKCGDWCPMFGEPMFVGDDRYMLQLHCANTSRLILSKLEDNR